MTPPKLNRICRWPLPKLTWDQFQRLFQRCSKGVQTSLINMKISGKFYLKIPVSIVFLNPFQVQFLFFWSLSLLQKYGWLQCWANTLAVIHWRTQPCPFDGLVGLLAQSGLSDQSVLLEMTQNYILAGIERRWAQTKVECLVHCATEVVLLWGHFCPI